jgi:hypothetical protein
MLHKMLCGGFSESKAEALVLNDVDGKIFIRALDIWLGKGQEMELGELQQLARVANMFRITEVLTAVEELLTGQLTLDMC